MRSFCPTITARQSSDLQPDRKEIGVTVGGNAGNWVMNTSVWVGIATELWQNVGPYAPCRKQRRSYDRDRKSRIQRISDQRMPDGFVFVRNLQIQYGCL